MEKKLTAFVTKHFGILLVLLLTVFALLPLLQSGFWPMHDDEQVGRLYDLHQALKMGHFPPRIAPNLGFGYGYPFFNFYPSFVYYIAEVFLVAGFSYIASIELMIAGGFIAAAVAMYYFSRKYLGQIGALVAALAYTYAPYHAVDVYVRGALPEFWSFVFIPAIFWAMKSLKDTLSGKYVILLSLFGAALILTHNLVAVMGLVFFLGYFLLLLQGSTDKKRFLLQIIASGMLALCLSAYFWLPSYIEKQYTMIELLTRDLADFRQHFVYLRQFWQSKWGYGGSLYGLNDDISFEIGKLHLIGVLLAFCIVPFIKKQRTITLFFLGAFVLAGFMATFRSQIIWEVIQPLSYIQFPWRFLLFTAFFSSFLVGLVISSIPSKKLQFVGVVVAIVIVLFYKDFFIPAKYFTDATDQDYISEEYIRWDTSKLAAEYVPLGIVTRKTDIGTLIVAIDKGQIASRSSEVISGRLRGQVTEIENLPHKKVFMIQAETPVVFRINTYSFPGWKVLIDRREVSYRDDNRFKLITVSVPPGNHHITAEFTDTPVRAAGNILTLAGWLSLVGYSGYLLRKHRKPSHK